MRRVLAIAIVALIACKKTSGAIVLGDEDEPKAPNCSSDADCAVVAVTDCCACCPNTDIYPVPKGVTYERRCSGHCKMCGGPGSDAGKAASCESNPNATDFTPECRSGYCEAVPKRK